MAINGSMINDIAKRKLNIILRCVRVMTNNKKDIPHDIPRIIPYSDANERANEKCSVFTIQLII